MVLNVGMLSTGVVEIALDRDQRFDVPRHAGHLRSGIGVVFLDACRGSCVVSCLQVPEEGVIRRYC